MPRNRNFFESVYKFFDSLEPDEYDCINFCGFKNNLPIGYYRVVGIDGVCIRVHRLALERKLGRPIKPGYFALHTCDNPSCINPKHLYEGTPADNVRDLVQRNLEFVRYSKGPHNLEHLKRIRKLPRNIESVAHLKSPQNVEHLKRIRKLPRNKEFTAYLKSPENLEHLKRIRKLPGLKRKKK
jgi:hypothetical protein